MPLTPLWVICETMYGDLLVPSPVTVTPLLPDRSLIKPVPSEPEPSTPETTSGSDFVPDPDMLMFFPAL